MSEQYNVELISFYGWWIGSVSLFAFISLLGIWYHIGRKQGDTGQVYLAFSIFFWFLSGMLNVVFADRLDQTDWKLLHDGFTSIFSLLNSLFILLALPWFRYIPPFLESIVKSKYWIVIVGLPFLFSVLPTITKMYNLQEYGFISELDVYYSILTLVFLGIILWSSFAKRGLMFLAVLSALCILITFFAQLFKMSESQISMLLLSAIFKSCLIMIFFALALSWVKELSERALLSNQNMYVSFLQPSKPNAKHSTVVELSGFGLDKSKTILLTQNSFNLLKLFCDRLISNNNWLEIKPKNDGRSNAVYDIKDHIEIRRLLHQILDGLYGKNNWSKEKHELPLRAQLFKMSDKRDRKIMLAIPASNISYE